MANVRDLLRMKGDQVWSVKPDATVLEALKLMAEKEVGALLVIDEGGIAGIISERDFARSIADMEECLIYSMVQDYMTTEIYAVGPDHNMEECMQLMTQKHIRHLPVLEKNRLVGLISIGDVVKEVISGKESTINILESYIEGRGYNQ